MGLGQKLELEVASYLSTYFWFFYSTASPPTPPAPTLIGRCCHDVFKFRTPPPPPHKHASTHTPPGINLPWWERGRSVSLQTFLITRGRRRQFDAGGCSCQGLGIGKFPSSLPRVLDRRSGCLGAHLMGPTSKASPGKEGVD